MPDGYLAALGGPRAIPKDFSFGVWPQITPDDEAFVLASLHQSRHGWGPNCVALQREFARWNGNRSCAACNSGTAALHMGLAACDVKPGDEVITTSLSWTSTGTCILHHNAIPVFVDVDADTMLIHPRKIEAAITRRTRAILVVHYYGLPCDMDEIMQIAHRHGLYVIEDACQSHGSTYKGRKAGTLGHCAAFSLNQNKNLCGGEGGLFVTDDDALYRRARALMNFGEMIAPEGARDRHSYAMGWMYRTSDLAAAFARSGLKRLDSTNEHAKRNWHRLRELLAGTPHVVLPPVLPDRETNGYAFVIRIASGLAPSPDAMTRLKGALLVALRAEGVPVHDVHGLLPAHAVFQARVGYGHGCPWDCRSVRSEVSYDLAQYPVARATWASSIQIGINAHRPPNGEEHLQMIARGISKVFGCIDELSNEQRTALERVYESRRAAFG